jgi:hypothetical protein
LKTFSMKVEINFHRMFQSFKKFLSRDTVKWNFTNKLTKYSHEQVYASKILNKVIHTPFALRRRRQNLPYKFCISISLKTAESWQDASRRASEGIVQCWNFKTIYGGWNPLGIGLWYRPGRLQRLAELIPWNRFLGSLTV